MDINKELDELFDDPLLDVSDCELSLFNIPSDMRRAIKRKQPEHYARATKCEDFEMYKPMFEKIHAELRTGKRSLARVSKTTDMRAGVFYIVDGMMLYVDKVEVSGRGSNGQKNGRTRCIFENGTETDILLQTLRKNVMSCGFGITETDDEIQSGFCKNEDVKDGDVTTGYIYVLRSLSHNPDIAAIQNLYKIGFTVNSVEERIANAQNEPTYLMAQVAIVAKYKIVNMNSYMFEQLIHQVLDCVQVQIAVNDADGKEHRPKEWFVVPIEVIDTIVMKILDGTITRYRYNTEQQCLEQSSE